MVGIVSKPPRGTSRGWDVIWTVTAICIAVMRSCCLAAPVEDRVVSLPLFGPPPTPHYSGYLDATDGCNTQVNGEYCKIHYWFCTADGPDAASKPVVYWSNGGPGSSSILGLLQELGPLLMNATGGLMVNPYSWTSVANVLVLESPVGVGYSYCATQAGGGVCENTDRFTASASRAALVDFFRKFPELQDNDFVLTGESYAGVYLPTLAYEILQSNRRAEVAKASHKTHPIDDNTSTPIRINLVAMAVGDPCTDNDAQKDSMDALWYGHKYGLVDDAVYDVLWNQCNVRLPAPLMRNDNRRHKKLQHQRNRTHPTDWVLSQLIEAKATDGDTNSKILGDWPPTCDLALKKFLLSTSHGLSQEWRDMFIDDYSLFAPVSDAEDQAMQEYMNRADVRAALHVTEAPIDSWPYPDGGFDYTKEYDACNDNVVNHGALSMIDFYRKLAPKLPGSIWIYNGDTDPCVSYEGTSTAVKRIGFSEIDGGGYRPWFYNHAATSVEVLAEKAVMFGPDLLLQDTGAQFGGEVVNYEHGLAFLTVHGSGHMVPQFRPQAALHMLIKLLCREELSPLMPTNATLTNMTDDEFSDAMDLWTETAKAEPYASDYNCMSAGGEKDRVRNHNYDALPEVD